MTALPTGVLDAAFRQQDRADDDRLGQDIVQRMVEAQQQAEAERQQQTPRTFSLPSLESLLGGGESAPAADPAPAQAQPSRGFTLPSLESLLGERPKPVQTPSGTPVPMPTAPAQPNVTIEDGREQPQPRLQPGESVGDVRISQGQPSTGATRGEIDNSSREAFVRTAYPYMLEAAGGDPALAEWMLAKAISENGDVGKGGDFIGNNFGGIKGKGPTGKSFTARTWEWENGQRVYQDAEFAAFDTPQEGMAAFMRFLQDNPRYHSALQRYRETRDPAQLFRDINAAGYATNPVWWQDVDAIRRSQVAPVLRQSAGQPVAEMPRAPLNAGGDPSRLPAASPSQAVPPAPSGAGGDPLDQARDASWQGQPTAYSDTMAYRQDTQQPYLEDPASEHGQWSAPPTPSSAAWDRSPTAGLPNQGRIEPAASPAADDPGGARFAAEDSQSTPPSWAYDSPPSVPATPGSPYAPGAMGEPSATRFEGPTQSQQIASQAFAPERTVAGAVWEGVQRNLIPGSEPYERGVRERQQASMRAYDDQQQRQRADRIVQQAQQRVAELVDEAQTAIASAPDEATARQLRDRYVGEIARVQEQAHAEAGQARQDEMRRQEEMAESATRRGQAYSTVDQWWDAADRAVGGALRAINGFYEGWRNAVARPVTDLLGTEQLGREAASDYAVVEALLAQYGRPENMPPPARAALDAAHRRIVAIEAQGERYASERNPATDQFRTGVDIAAGLASIPVMPGYGQAANVLRGGTAAQRAGMVGRLAAGTALDPTGAVFQGAIEAPIAAVQGARAVGRGARAPGDRLPQPAAADDGVRLLGSGVVPASPAGRRYAVSDAVVRENYERIGPVPFAGRPTNTEADVRRALEMGYVRPEFAEVWAAQRGLSPQRLAQQGGDYGWAARWTNDIEGDVTRGTASAGWGYPVFESEDEVRAYLRDMEGVLGDPDDTLIAYDERVGGFIPFGEGLSSFTGSTPREAVENALSDASRFEGRKLYVFPARIIGEDEDTLVFGLNIRRVRPIGNPAPVRGTGEWRGSGAAPTSSPGLRPTLANAAQGALVGAVSEDFAAQQEGRETDPWSRLGRGAAGAALAVGAGRAMRGRAGQRVGSGLVPDGGQSWDDFSRSLDTPEDIAARERMRRQGTWRENGSEESRLRSEFGRRYEDPQTSRAFGDASADMLARAQGRAGDEVVPARELPDLARPDRIEPQGGINLNAMGAGAAAGGLSPEGEDGLSPEERGQRMLVGAGLGLIFGRRPRAQSAAASGNPVMQRMARQMAGQHSPSGVTNRRGLLERWAQAWTDDRAALRTFQDVVSQRIGRPLTAGESVAELTRINPASVAHQRLDDALRAPLQAVGDDEDYLAQFLVHAHNVDVAREMGQRAYDAAIAAGRTPAQASAAAMRAADARQFSGDLHLSDTTQAIKDIERRVRSLPDGDARWQAIQDAADAVWTFNRETLQRKRDAGIIADALYQELTRRYPRYVRTDIADYFDKGTGGPAPAGRRLGVSDIGIQKISPQGTIKDRVNPLLSTIDQTYSAEAAIARNEAAKAFEELLRLDPSWQAIFKEVTPARGVHVGDPATTVPASYTLKNGEQFLRVWDRGQARTFVIPPEYAALVSPRTPALLNSDNLGAKLWRGAMEAYKALITSKNPAFAMVVSPLRDMGDYAIREGVMSAKDRGPLGFAQGATGALGAMGDYFRAIPDAFAGITTGSYKGDLAQMMRQGAGQMSRPRHEQVGLRSALRDLQRTNGLEVRSVGDAMRLVGDILTIGAGPIGNRLEQVPRLAAARRAGRRGASDLGQAMAFRDATVDFQRAGEVARVVNTVVPFFNVAMQGGAQVARTFRANPAAYFGAVAATAGVASMAAEAWNRADEGRASDYDDVPDYLKKTGIVIMLPGVEGVSQRGDRLPNYLWLPVGQYGALLQAAKEAAADHVAGKASADLSTFDGWKQLGADVAGIFSPIRGESAGSVLTSVTPPGLSTGLELAANRDLFRDATIATDRKDEQASALSHGAAGLWNAVTGQETRPSQWEYLYRDLGGYGATLATEASNRIAERMGNRPPKDEDRPIQNAPILGGLVNRVVRDAGGQRLEEATEEVARVPERVRPILEEAGLRRDQVPSVPSSYKGAPLTREEQERWQTATNSMLARELAAVRRSSEWRERGADKGKLVQEAMSRARELAAEHTLRRLTDAEIEKRKQRETRRKAS